MDSDSDARWLALELNYISAHQLVSEYQGSPGLKGEGRDYLLRQAAVKSHCREVCILARGKFVAITQSITPTLFFFLFLKI